MKMSRIARLVFPCLCCVLAQQAFAAEVYRWVDAAGEVHRRVTGEGDDECDEHHPVAVEVGVRDRRSGGEDDGDHQCGQAGAQNHHLAHHRASTLTDGPAVRDGAAQLLLER